MKKIGIVTIIDNHNFGNRLQNYATYYIFKKYLGLRAMSLASHCGGRAAHGALIPGLKDSAVVALSHVHGLMENRFSPRINRWLSFAMWSQRIPLKHYYYSYIVLSQPVRLYGVQSAVVGECRPAERQL